MRQVQKYLAGAAILSMVLAGCSKSDSDSLDVTKTVTYELGDKVILDASEFLPEDTDQDVIDNVEIESDLMDDSDYTYSGFTKEVTSSDKNCLGVGTYAVTLKYDGKTYDSEIVVEDTTAPTFVTKLTSIVVAQGETEEQVLMRFKVSDKDDVELSLDGDYDLDEAGTYLVDVIAKDASGNRSALEVTMKVVSGDQMITSEDQLDEDIDSILNEDADDDVTEDETNVTISTSDGSGTSSDSGSSSSASGNTSSSTGSSTSSSSSSTGTSTGTTSSGSSSDTSADEDTSTGSDDTTGSTTTTACSASNVAAGASYYYSFDEAYAAGTAWNQQDPNNYFFYLAGTDDCGTPIYVVTFGTSDMPYGGTTTDDWTEEN